jgi:putative NADH-flavin reductase
MKIIVIGANGKTGSLVVQQALDKGFRVTAYIRRPGTLTIDHQNLKIVVGELNEIFKLKNAMEGADACVSTLGGISLKEHSTAIMEGIDNIVMLMEELNIPRFIYLSSIGVGESRKMMPFLIRLFITKILFRIPLADHLENERLIMNSDLEWTFVRPGSLTEGNLTRKFRQGSDFIKLKGNLSISRANVAWFIVNELIVRNYTNQAVWLTD